MNPALASAPFDEQIQFAEEGLSVISGLFSEEEVALLRRCAEQAITRDTPDRVLEKDGRTVRALHGTHLHDPVLDRLTKLPRLVERARRLLRGDVYVYQFKINTKAAFTGDVWPWHQDYIYWKNEDGMPRSQAVTFILMLDDVTEFNGPVYAIPKSHLEGCLEAQPYRGSGWEVNVSADLKYTLDRDVVRQLGLQHGLVSLSGPAGTLAIMDCNAVHCSPPNVSPFRRLQLLVTYNRVDNAPAPARLHRPEFLVTRAAEPVVAVSSDELWPA